MLIKRKPQLSWFINFLAIFLMCILIANSILGSIYINNLKNRMAEITDNYFLAERKLQTAIESLVQTRISLLRYSLALQNKTDEESFAKVKSNILSEFQRNEINLSSLILSLQKQETNKYMDKPIAELYMHTTQYLLDLENTLSTNSNTNLAQFMEAMDQSAGNYVKIKEQLETLTEILRQRAYDVENSDSLIAQYFPPILLASFFIALIIGGSFIYVSRREVRLSVIEQTSQVLSEAYQYQVDCIQTLQICQDILELKVNECNSEKVLEKDEQFKKEWQDSIVHFTNLARKIQNAFAMRGNLHNSELANLEKTRLKIKDLEKKQ